MAFIISTRTMRTSTIGDKIELLNTSIGNRITGSEDDFFFLLILFLPHKLWINNYYGTTYKAYASNNNILT